ncbi:MAG: D-alanyl-D-alanine carboxypeptidase/D-alanyl-D-alanine-endopeptidase [Vicinamibacterales bacterium]
MSAAQSAAVPAPVVQSSDGSVAASSSTLARDLDAIFADPVLARGIIGVRVDSLRDGRTIYTHMAGTHVVPASNMKLVTMSVAATRLGWDFRYETRLEATGTIRDGRLDGDLVVVGSGDPTIGAPDGRPSSVFVAWADALWDAGVHRIDGRLIGDDNAFEDAEPGAGWAWDYLSAGYATPTGALIYNENVGVVRATPGPSAGDPVAVTILPPGHGLEPDNRLTTGAAGSRASLDVFRMAGEPRVVLTGSQPAGGRAAVQTVAVDNPTRYFVEALRLALLDRGIVVRDGAWDIDDLSEAPPAGGRRVLVRRESAPLSSIAASFLKVSQNLYGETILRTLARADGNVGTADGGKAVVRRTLADWGVADDAIVMYDGSGLSRYNYVTADAIVTILTRIWKDESLRGPFLAALPVGGVDGTLESRMKNPVLEGHVQAKTGTISNMRALSGFLDGPDGEKYVFSMIANHFTAPSAQIDAVVEKALARIVSGSGSTAPGS